MPIYSILFIRQKLLAVENFQAVIDLYEKLLNAPCYKIEIVESERMQTAFFQAGETKIELLEGLDDQCAISKFIKRGTKAYTTKLLR